MFPSGWIWSHLPPPTSHCAPRCIPIAKNPWCFSTLSVFFPNGFPHEIPRNPTEFHWNPIEIPLNPIEITWFPFRFSQRSKKSHVPGLFDQRLIDFGLQKAQLFRLAPGISWLSRVSRSPSMGIWGISNISMDNHNNSQYIHSSGVYPLDLSMMRIWVNHNNSLSHGKIHPFYS